MEKTPEEIIKRIVDAFKQQELPEGAAVFESYSNEVDSQTIERLARQTTWIDFPHDVLWDNPIALFFMTPEAFAWLLPAYLVISVALYSESDTLTGSILTCLTPSDDEDAREFLEMVEEMRVLAPDLLLEEAPTDTLGEVEEQLQWFIERVAVLTPDEKAAIRDYLEYIDAAYGADFPTCGPKQALDRYWTRAARSADG